jgi:hypothetical protein
VVHMVVYTHEYASQPPVSGRGRRTNDALTVERSLETSRQAISRVRHEIDKVLTPRLPGKECALLDFPHCSNAGDSAIRVGEQILLSKLGVKPAYVCTTENRDWNAMERPSALAGQSTTMAAAISTTSDLTATSCSVRTWPFALDPIGAAAA